MDIEEGVMVFDMRGQTVGGSQVNANGGLTIHTTEYVNRGVTSKDEPVALALPASFANAFAKAKAERLRQERKWGHQHHDLAWWSVILGEEYGEACKAIYEYMSSAGSGTIDEVIAELTQVAAVALAALQDIEEA
jgi:hypothetical protein